MKSRSKAPVANAFDRTTSKGQSAAAKNGELWSDRTPESLRAIEHLLHLSPIETLKYECCIQLAHIQRMEELQHRVGIILPGFRREIRKLLQLVRPVYEAEIAAATKNDQEGRRSVTASPKTPQDNVHVDLTPEEAEAVKHVDAFFKRIRDEIM